MRDLGAARAQPAFGGLGQALDDGVIIDRVEAAELRSRRAERRDEIIIDLRENPSGELSVLSREPGLGPDLLEMRIEPRRMGGPAFRVERRREAFVILVDKPRQLAKAEKISKAVRRKDLDCRHCLGSTFLWSAARPAASRTCRCSCNGRKVFVASLCRLHGAAGAARTKKRGMGGEEQDDDRARRKSLGSALSRTVRSPRSRNALAPAGRFCASPADL